MDREERVGSGIVTSRGGRRAGCRRRVLRARSDFGQQPAVVVTQVAAVGARDSELFPWKVSVLRQVVGELSKWSAQRSRLRLAAPRSETELARLVRLLEVLPC